MQNQFVGSFFIVLLIILVLLTIFGIAWLYITSRTKERLALIEKGMDPNLAALVDATMAGEAFDAAKEKAAKENGWR